jgi:hypothetical protein
MLGRRALASATRAPFYDAIDYNHFTTKFMPNELVNYKLSLIEKIKTRYIIIYDDWLDNPCPHTTMPKPDDIMALIGDVVNNWVKKIAEEVNKTCELKLDVYNEFLPQFKDEKDDYRIGICEECIKKNTNYITELKRIT